VSVRIQTGDTERIEAVVLDGSLDPLTGKTDILLSIRRVSDGQWYDFSDDTFKASGWTTRQEQMTETDATNDPGTYHSDFDTSAITNAAADDTYEVRVDQSPGTDAANLPLVGEIKVGGFVDDIDQALSTTESNITTAIGALNDLSVADVQTAMDNQGYTVARAGNLDNLDAAISAVTAAIGALNDLSQADVQAALTAQGYTSGRALNLDNLDAAISAVISAIAALNDLSQADVQAALTAQGYTAGRAGNLDNLDATISAVISAIAALNDITIADVQTAMTAQGYTAARAAYLDDLVTILAAAEKIRKVTTNRVVVNASDTLITVYEDDDTTPAFTFTVTPDRRERTP
jgi:hypothetical protein